MAGHPKLKTYAAEIRRNNAVLVDTLKATGYQLRQVKEIVPAELSDQWAFQELGLDAATIQDIFAFDGTMNSVTDRMVRWIVSSADRGRTS